MVEEYKILKIGSEELLEIDCSEDAKADLKTPRVKNILAQTGNKNIICLKTRHYKKLYRHQTSEYYPSFVNYYLNNIKGDTVEKSNFNTHKVIISRKGVESFYNIIPRELELSFNEIKLLSELFDSFSDKDLPNDFFSFKKYFRGSNFDDKLL